MSAVQKFYDARIRETVDQKSEEVREQVEQAFANSPASADEVDPWFEEHFHEPPVSHDTQLYNFLHASKAGLREVFSK